MTIIPDKEVRRNVTGHLAKNSNTGAVKIICDSNIPKGNIIILFDSQVANRALGSNAVNFTRTIYGCWKQLNRVANRYKVHIVLVSGYNDIPGNCRAHELAGRGTIIKLSNVF